MTKPELLASTALPEPTHDDADTSGGPSDDVQDRLDFWYSLITEADAARFLNLSVHTLRAYRSRGGGPSYVRISSRCIRYRRSGLRDWAEMRIRISTADEGTEVAHA